MRRVRATSLSKRRVRSTKSFRRRRSKKSSKKGGANDDAAAPLLKRAGGAHQQLGSEQVNNTTVSAADAAAVAEAVDAVDAAAQQALSEYQTVVTSHNITCTDQFSWEQVEEQFGDNEALVLSNVIQTVLRPLSLTEARTLPLLWDNDTNTCKSLHSLKFP